MQFVNKSEHLIRRPRNDQRCVKPLSSVKQITGAAPQRHGREVDESELGLVSTCRADEQDASVTNSLDVADFQVDDQRQVIGRAPCLPAA